MLKELYGGVGEDGGDSEEVVNPPPIYGLYTKIFLWLRVTDQVQRHRQKFAGIR